MRTPWAILLCKFSDDDSEPYARTRYEQLFTSAGRGLFNMVDFFRDMSHGKLDLNGSQVFGWYVLDKARAEYTGSGANPQGRKDLIDWARKAALDDGADLSKFFSVVVCMNVATDLFGGPDGVVCDDDRWPNGMSAMSPSLLGQEMGHVYGLNHSRADGSTGDYNDPWDVMSTAVWPTMGAHPNFTDMSVRGEPVFRLGPGINAANMSSRDWLDRSRVWTAGESQHGTTVQLRPLHRHDLAGYLMAQVGQYVVEFRVPERWDSGIDAPMVLVHTFFNGHSYLERPSEGELRMVEGDSFRYGDAGDPLGAVLQVDVADIDAANAIARLVVTRKPNRHPQAGPGHHFGAVTSDGGGFVIVGGQIVWIPPRSPLLPVLEKVAQFEGSEAFGRGPAVDLLKQDALQSISTWAQSELHQRTAYRTPASPMMELRESGVSGPTTAASVTSDGDGP